MSSRIVFATAAAVAACLPMGPFAATGWAATNLIANPGFESGESPTYPGVGIGWETNDAQPHPDITVLTTATKHSGSYSQWLKANPNWDLGMVRQVTNYNTVTPGKTYRIRAWVKTANVQNPSGWYVFGVWAFNNDSKIAESKMPQQETLNYDWREITWTVVAPPDANRVAAILTRHTDGDAWYDDIFIGEEDTSPPAIGLTPASFYHRIIVGTTPLNDVFHVFNDGGGLLNYTIAESTAWLGVSSTSGQSAGELDPVTINYTTGSLSIGNYDSTITVSDTNASNSPQSVAISLAVRTPGDIDLDGDVDQEDFGLLQVCLSGDGIEQTSPACRDARMDGDVDVDAADFALFAGCLSGAGVPASPTCVPGS